MIACCLSSHAVLRELIALLIDAARLALGISFGLKR